MASYLLFTDARRASSELESGQGVEESVSGEGGEQVRKDIRSENLPPRSGRGPRPRGALDSGHQLCHSAVTRLLCRQRLRALAAIGRMAGGGGGDLEHPRVLLSYNPTSLKSFLPISKPLCMSAKAAYKTRVPSLSGHEPGSQKWACTRWSAAQPGTLPAPLTLSPVLRRLRRTLPCK